MMLSTHLSAGRKARWVGSSATDSSLLERTLWKILRITDEIVIGMKSLGVLGSLFLSMNIVLERQKAFGTLPDHIKINSLANHPFGNLLRAWHDIRSRPTAVLVGDYAFFISLGVMGNHRASRDPLAGDSSGSVFVPEYIMAEQYGSINSFYKLTWILSPAVQYPGIFHSTAPFAITRHVNIMSVMSTRRVGHGRREKCIINCETVSTIMLYLGGTCLIFKHISDSLSKFNSVFSGGSSEDKSFERLSAAAEGFM